MKRASNLMARAVKQVAGTLALFSLLALQAHADSTLQNPLNSAFSTIPGFISGVLKVVVYVALPIVTLFFVVAGFQFVSAQGNSGKLQKARENFFFAVLGALLIMGAWVIATLIAGTVKQLVG